MQSLLILLALAPQLQIEIQAPGQARRLPGSVTAMPRGDIQDGEGQASGNVVLVLADDFGVDLVGAYGEAPNPPCTPVIDDLAANGILFRNAWANPTCSPTRATTLTGRYPFRHGIGIPAMSGGLQLTEITIPEVLSTYTSAALGKWHLGGQGGGADHPNDSGFWRYAGGLGGVVSSYTGWDKTIDGDTSTVTTYATSDTADEAILAAQTLPEPFFLYVCFNAPHTPLHVPPAELCTDDYNGCDCDSTPSNAVERGKAMVEALDEELGRMLEGIRAVDANVLTILMGDNGTANQLVEPPWQEGRVKGSVYEGGINVPLIVNGPGVAVGECAGLVSAADLHATIAEWTGNTSAGEDSVSMVPYFTNPGLSSLRETVFAEQFIPNSGPPYSLHDRAVRNADYKLIRKIGQADELYATTDSFELTDLFLTLVPGTTPHDNYLALVQVLVDLGVD